MLKLDESFGVHTLGAAYYSENDVHLFVNQV